MKRFLIIAFMTMGCVTGALGQDYRFQFEPKGCTDSVLYIARHYRDDLQVVDTARRVASGAVFVASGRRDWKRGVYALVHQDRESAIADFLVDDSRKMSIAGDSMLSASSVKVSGSKSNRQMFDYMARLESARTLQESLNQLGDRQGLDKLDAEMSAFVVQARREGGRNLFHRLVAACDNPTVPDSVKHKATYFRDHYWDNYFAALDSAASASPAEGEAMKWALLHSPQLFSKMNFYFFGLLYRANSDTIIASLDGLMDRIGADTAMRRYVLQFVEPRYYRSTQNIGWDAVWCHLVERYYQAGLCPWARESELYVMQKNYKRISKSIIGAHAPELWMLDTTQIDAPDHWISSHRFPERYVILWFWDPDCHHCQEQSEQLKVLYDSLSTAGAKRFEVYAVGYASDVDKWKRYVRKHAFPWVNVGGNNVNIDYQEAFNVHGAPTMIILNEKRDIIMNKVLPIKDLMHWLDNYEQREREKHSK